MSLEKAIKEIEELGLIIWFLDDGWYNNHSKRGNFYVSLGIINDHQTNYIINKIKKIFDFDTHVINSKKYTSRALAIPAKYNLKLYESIVKYFNNNIDIISKKINPLKQNWLIR